MDDRSTNPPRRLTDWPAFFWSQVLFPGTEQPSATAVSVRSLLLLIILPAVLLYLRLDFALFEPDESRYAEIPREMILHNDFIVPNLQSEPYLDKPPLFYWLVAASYHLFGVGIAAARFIPALAVHGSVLLVYLFGRRRFGERAAFWGAMGLMLAPGFLGMGRLLILDGLLTFWVTLSLFSGFEAIRGERFGWGWWLLAACACGLGVLTKGPVALLLLLPPLWLYRWLGGKGCSPSRAGMVAFAVIVVAIAGPWYVAVCLREPEFARTFFWEHNVMRFLTPFAHERGIWFYGPVLLAGLFPATLVTLPFLGFLNSADPARIQRRTADFGFLILAGGWCVLFFTLSACKLPTYILPALPPLALAFGYFAVQERWTNSRWTHLAVGGTFALIAGTNFFVLPWYARYRSPVGRADDLVRLCSDPSVKVVCYPRNCDSASFFLGRDDLHAYRSKDIEQLRELVRAEPRTVILCTHRHALHGLRQLLPPDRPVVESVHHGLGAIPGVPKGMMRVLAGLMGETALGLCDVAVIEPRPTDKPIPPASDGTDLDPFEESDSE